MKMLFLLNMLIVINYQSIAQTSSKLFALKGAAIVVEPESRAVKSFERSYPFVSGEKWRIDASNHIVTFTDKGIKHKIVYTQNGQVDYALKIYKEDALPRQVREALKSIYYDYSITGVQELHLRKKVIFLVKMKDAATWKTVRVCNGDVEEIENLSISQ